MFEHYRRNTIHTSNGLGTGEDSKVEFLAIKGQFKIWLLLEGILKDSEIEISNDKRAKRGADLSQKASN